MMLRSSRAPLAPRLARDVVRFLRTPLDAESSRTMLRTALASREQRLVDILERSVFARPDTVYARLFAHAGIELGDVRHLVLQGGVEDALRSFYEGGVRVGLDELRGVRPIVRGRLELPVTPGDFANPLSTHHYLTRSSGSRSEGRLVPVDLGMLEHEAAHHSVFLDSFGLRERPMAVWALAVPVSAGLKNVLRHAKVGLEVERWFSPTPLRPRRGAAAGAGFTAYAVAASRLGGVRLPWPETVPLARAGLVAEWLARRRAAGAPAVLWTSVSAATRVCMAAVERELDLSGTTFRVGGEPLTVSKAALIESTGCAAVANYSMSEVGKVAVACAESAALDDMHILGDKVALLRVPTSLRLGGGTVEALHATTLHERAPRLLVNVETGDEATLVERSCGCAYGELGFVSHVHGVRSYEKVTVEGSTFRGDDLVELVEVDLPAAFGGGPTDYQLLEHEDGGPSRLSVLVSPRLGEVDEGAVVAAVVARLGRRGIGEQLTAEMWRDAGTIRVERREPLMNGSLKLLPLRSRR